VRSSSNAAIQSRQDARTAWTDPLHHPHYSRVRVLPHKRLDDCLGDFLVRVVCECGACREIQPQALARLAGWKMTHRELALRMRCSQCGQKAGGCGRCEARPRRAEEFALIPTAAPRNEDAALGGALAVACKCAAPARLLG